MRRFFQLLALLTAATLACWAGVASADELGDARSRVIKLENDWTQLDASRVRLERESNDLGAQIEQVKSEPAGVRRDFKLRELLAQAKSKADELTRVAAELRWRTAPLGDARLKLIAACDRALGQPNLNEARRLELARLRTTQAALLATPTAPLGKVAPVAVDPLDGPRELKEKADLLRDSGDKLKREVARLSARIDDVERRRHLRERAGAVDEDWFGETTSNRKFARIGGANTNAAPAAATPRRKTRMTPTTRPRPAPRRRRHRASPAAPPVERAAPAEAEAAPLPPAASTTTAAAAKPTRTPTTPPSSETSSIRPRSTSCAAPTAATISTVRFGR
jgi:hypothetical protein